MLPNESDVSPSRGDYLGPHRSRAESESRQLRGTDAVQTVVLRRNNNELSNHSPEGNEQEVVSNHGSRSNSVSHGGLADLFRFRRKSVNPAFIILPTPDGGTKSTVDGEAQCDAANHSGQRTSSGHHRPRSISTTDRPQIYLTDPSINRPQVVPTKVESLRAKMFRQKRDLAPQWVKMAPKDGGAPSFAVNGHEDVQTSRGDVIMPESPPRRTDGSNWNTTGSSEIGTMGYKDTERRISLFPTISSGDSEFGSSMDIRSRTGSRGLTDFFRILKKSSSNNPGPLPSPESNDSTTKSPQRNQKKTFLPGLQRQRSKSTADPPNYSELQAYAEGRTNRIVTTEPISVRVFNAKMNLRLKELKSSVSGPTLSTESQNTPMSDLLIRQASPTQLKATFGINDFLELYKNFTTNSSEAKKEAEKSPERRISDTHQPVTDNLSLESGDDADRPSAEIPSSRTKAILNLQLSLQQSIPEHDEVHQVSSSLSIMPRPLRKISPSSFYYSSERDTNGEAVLDTMSSRRYSEPQKPSLGQLAMLNSIHMKFVSKYKNGTDQDEQGARNVRSPPSIAQSLGIKIPMTSRHKLLLWRDKDAGTQLLKLPVGCHENNELYNIDSNDKLTFVKLMKLHKCHELMPQSSMLVLLDSELEVIAAFYALAFNGIRSAPIWDSSKRDFVGMLTVTDFINVLQMYYDSPEEIGNLEEHRISKWIDLFHGPRESIISIDPDDSLFDAVTQLTRNKIHRILVADTVSGDALYVLNYKRILQFMYLLTYEVEQPSYMEQSIWELQVGTYDGKLCSVMLNTRLIDALNLLVARRVSALPVVDDNGRAINIYAKVDAINLAIDEAYKKLDSTIQEALEAQRRDRFEGVFVCRRTDTLRQIMQWFIQEDIHRILVVDDDLVLAGIVSLSDIVHFLVIKQFQESPDIDVQPGDIEAELDLSL